MNDIKYKKSTWILILNELWELLFLKRKSNWLWTTPGGKTDEWECSFDCAVRELKEETWIKNVELKFYTYTTSFTNWIHWQETSYIWYINDETEIKNAEEDIYSEIRFFDLNELPDFKEIEWYDYDLIMMLRWEMKRNTEKPHPWI